jgi:hypothetical protein
VRSIIFDVHKHVPEKLLRLRSGGVARLARVFSPHLQRAAGAPFNEETPMTESVMRAPNANARRSHTYLARAIIANARCFMSHNQDLDGGLRREWPGDKVTPILVTRAAASPATTTTSGWAADVAAGVPWDVISTLGPASGGSQLLARGLNVRLGRYASVTIPSVTAASTGIGFIAQGAPMPVRQLDTTPGLTITPNKLAVGFALTHEIVQGSNAEALVKAIASENIAAALDAALFSTQAGNIDQPSGLLRNLVTLGATANAAGVDSLRADLGKLATAVAPIAGDQIAFVAAPGTAVKIRLALGGADWAYPIFSSGQVASTTVIAVALNALVAATGEDMRIETSIDATLHLETAPTQQLSESGFQAGAQVRSLFQSDSVGIKLVFPVSWGLRDAAGVAMITGINW